MTTEKHPTDKRPAPPAAVPRVRPTERLMGEVHRLMGEHEFASLDEANAFLQQALASGRPERREPASPLDRAQELMYDAWEEPAPKRRAALAKQALEISPDCADAYVLLADETARTHGEAARLYEKGVAAGERALGLRTFADQAGHFWGLLETRPYMRARLGFAQELWAMGMHQPALDHYEAMLYLNPGDNQGIRYLLAGALAELERDDELEDLLEDPRFSDDGAAAWVFTRALLAFRRAGSAAGPERLLRIALSVNRHVPGYLLGREPLPRELPGLIGFGDESEAIVYAADFGKAWRKTQGALEWMEKVGAAGKSTPRRRGKR